jgi:PD-(D/E)XK nuclease superfamily
MDRRLTPSEWPPTLRPLDRVSPTVGAQLLECELRVAFRFDERFAAATRTTSTAAALGTISHSLAEAVAAGSFDRVAPGEVGDALEAAWLDRLRAAEAALANAHPSIDLPPPARWPGYESVHTRTIDALRVEVGERRKGPHRATGAVDVELELRPENVPLEGRVDRAEQIGEDVELVDLKTGWSLREELDPKHRRQLLVYAYLWHAKYGVWPRRASVQRLSGARLTFEVDPAEAEAVASELVRARATYNERVEDRVTALQLASPSDTSCQHCDFRSMCPAFFDAINPSWPWHRKSCLGHVVRTTRSRQAVRVDLSVVAGNLGGREVALLNVAEEEALSRGDLVSVVDADPTRQAQALRCDGETRLTVWQRVGDDRRASSDRVDGRTV